MSTTRPYLSDMADNVAAGMLARVPHASVALCLALADAVAILVPQLGTDHCVGLALKARIRLLNKARETARREAANASRPATRKARRVDARRTGMALRSLAGVNDDDYEPGMVAGGTWQDRPKAAPGRAGRGHVPDRNLGASIPVSRGPLGATVEGIPVDSALEAEIARTLYRGAVETIRLSVAPFFPGVGDMLLALPELTGMSMPEYGTPHLPDSDAGPVTDTDRAHWVAQRIEAATFAATFAGHGADRPTRRDGESVDSYWDRLRAHLDRCDAYETAVLAAAEDHPLILGYAAPMHRGIAGILQTLDMA